MGRDVGQIFPTASLHRDHSISYALVCEKNRIHHWCSVWTEKSQHEGPPFQWETRHAKFPTGTVEPRVGIFLEPLNTNDRFFFSFTTTVPVHVWYSTVYNLLVTSMGSMFTVNDARYIQINLKQRINSALNNEQIVIFKWIYKN